MKRMIRYAVAFVAMVWMAVILPVSQVHAYASGTGTLHITPSQDGGGTTYDAYRIADDAALPQNDQFDWSALSGAELDGHAPYPSYDPSTPTAAADGRALVERVSDDILQDDAGVLAYALSDYIVKTAEPAARVVSGGSAVSVDDGWYLLVAEGRRPLLAWVDGKAVELGDKSDAPVVSKRVSAGIGWNESAVVGAGSTISYRVDASIPTAVEAFKTYPLVIVDEWDKALVLDVESVQVELVPSTAKNASSDVTDQVAIELEDDSLQVDISNVLDFGARPGDVIRVSYSMTLSRDARATSAGFANAAHAVFSTWKGDAQTPVDEARVYALNAHVTKVNESGEPLAGAVFALRNETGWLAADGSFGDESKRAEFTTNDQGVLEGMPLLSNGSYELVELAAPKGYRLSEKAAPLQLDVKVSEGTLELKARATYPLRVAKVDAATATASFEFVNKAETGSWGGFIPQTGDSAWWIAAVTLVVAGSVALMLGRHHKERA